MFQRQVAIAQTILPALFCAAIVFAPFQADAATKVPAGNRNAEQPAIPGASKKRTAALKTTFDAKYEKIRDLIAENDDLRSKIRKTANRYDIDPMHIVGALVGEHTYNVDAYDRLQSYYVKAVSYAGERFRFEHDGEKVTDFIERPEFAACNDLKGSARQWTCREDIWDTVFRGKSAGGKEWPNDRFSAVFFQPFFAGQTFGLGQLNPLVALTHSDRVSSVSGLPKLNPAKAGEVYQAIMDPDSTLAYMAADLADAITAYRETADFDISGNPGVTATLYNVGNAWQRAARLAAENRSRAAKGQKPKLPEENYYGWLVNDREEELRAIIAR